MEFNKPKSLVIILNLFYYLILIIIIDISLQKNISKQNVSNYNEVKINIKTRKLNDNEEEEEEVEEIEYYEDFYSPLNIYLDLNNFNNKIPNHLKNDINTFIITMNNAKEALGKFILIHEAKENDEIYNNEFKK